MKYQALFCQKNNKECSRLSSAAVVMGALRVKAKRAKILIRHNLIFETLPYAKLNRGTRESYVYLLYFISRTMKLYIYIVKNRLIEAPVRIISMRRF